MISPQKAQWVAKQFLCEEVLEELDREFTAIKTPYMPIKGAYLICSGLSSYLPYREMQDIDILVHQEHLKKVTEYFFSLRNVTPVTHYNTNYRPYETQFQYHIRTQSIPVEIHSLLNFRDRFLLETEDLFTRAVKKGAFRYLPSATDSLLIFICHLQTHISFHFRDTDFDEIRLLSEQNGFRWEEFWERAEGTGIKSFFKLILRIYNQRTRHNVGLNEKVTFIENIQLSYVADKDLNKIAKWKKRFLFEIFSGRKTMSSFRRKMGAFFGRIC